MVSSTMSSSAAAGVPKDIDLTGRNPWILNPFLDFTFVFGGFVWVIFGFCYFANGAKIPTFENARWLWTIAILAQFFIADPHNSATYMRIYATPESRERFRFYAYVLPILISPVFFIGIFNSAFAGLMGFVYTIWVFQHYAAQAFGISLIYCYKQEYGLAPLEREIFRWLVYSIIGLSISRMLVYEEFRPKNLMGVACPNLGLLPAPFYYLFATLTCVFLLGFVAVLFKKLVSEKKMIPIPALFSILTVAALGFTSGNSSGILWLFAPAFFHGSQYIAISLAYYLKERGLPENIGYKQIASAFASTPAYKYLGIIALAGITMYVGIPEIGRTVGLDRNVVALSVLCAVNFHHFLTDAAIWKLRDKRCRDLLLA